jgi:hypothetical protein
MLAILGPQLSCGPCVALDVVGCPTESGANRFLIPLTRLIVEDMPWHGDRDKLTESKVNNNRTKLLAYKTSYKSQVI